MHVFNDLCGNLFNAISINLKMYLDNRDTKMVFVSKVLLVRTIFQIKHDTKFVNMLLLLIFILFLWGTHIFLCYYVENCLFLAYSKWILILITSTFRKLLDVPCVWIRPTHSMKLNLYPNIYISNILVLVPEWSCCVEAILSLLKK